MPEIANVGVLADPGLVLRDGLPMACKGALLIPVLVALGDLKEDAEPNTSNGVTGVDVPDSLAAVKSCGCVAKLIELIEEPL